MGRLLYKIFNKLHVLPYFRAVVEAQMENASAQSQFDAELKEAIAVQGVLIIIRRLRRHRM